MAVSVIGHLTRSTDPLERVITFTYTQNGIDLLEARNSHGAGTDLIGKWEYNSQHLPVNYIDGSGQKTTYTYNSFGEKTKVTNALNETITYKYDPKGYLIGLSSPMSGAADL